MHSPRTVGLEPRQIIRQLMQERGISSDRALAARSGVSQPTLSRYLNGTSSTMELENFQLLAQALGVTISELVGEVPIGSSQAAREMAAVFEQLPEDQQRALLAAGRALISSQPAKK